MRKNYGDIKLYKLWDAIKDRCYRHGNCRYYRYGGRGITVCPGWKKNSRAFVEWAKAHGYKEGLQIDRINNDGDYSPANCRFVTHRENNLNKGIQASNTSGYIGVSWHKSSKKWDARIKVHGKQKYLGLFNSPRMAACRRDVEAMKFGYKTNF